MIQQIFDPISIIIPQMHFLKDMILVMRMVTLLGGFVVFTNPQLFSSNVSNLMKWNFPNVLLSFSQYKFFR